MYLRPASWAQATASSRLWRARTLASLISIGRLRPAITSALVCSITEMARFEGVPPNISVSRMTPAPVSTRPQAARMSLRRRSMSSSGPMQMASTAACGPTTCSMAKTNSSASRPCVTITSPIIRKLPTVSPPARLIPSREAVLNTPLLRCVKELERATEFRRGRSLPRVEHDVRRRTAQNLGEGARRDPLRRPATDHQRHLGQRQGGGLHHLEPADFEPPVERIRRAAEQPAGRDPQRNPVVGHQLEPLNQAAPGQLALAR